MNNYLHIIPINVYKKKLQLSDNINAFMSSYIAYSVDKSSNFHYKAYINKEHVT